ncbi:hypothetical protein OG204_31205 [Streptomyces sp. NBC_01387]|uniref:hypothetical protein n=1 Tax=unclassified Streptomyces TaxID=2593676 RepID=UPI002DD8CCC5|nr:hypothetical protein [Streptomyces sp. NBC_01766]WSC18888.1 hypothetical protein OIE60_04000 [Streptomyces sp. NBC_01766]
MLQAYTSSVRTAADEPVPVVAPDGRTVPWEGFCTGPVVLSPDDLQAVSHRLLGLDLSQVPAAARAELEPYGALRGEQPAVVIGAATSLKKCFEADLAHVVEGTSPDDFASYNEARAVYLAGPGDLVVGRTEPWRQAVAASEAEGVEVPGLEFYYLTHALLTQAMTYAESGERTGLHRIVSRLREAPHTVVRLFALDLEAQILLVWLRRTAGPARLRVDANGPEIGRLWNHKTTLYPTVEEAEGLADGARRADPYELLAAESHLTPFHREFGVVLPRVPGYSISRAGAGLAEVTARVAGAARLLRERYGLPLGCFKPATGLTGSRIRTAVPLGDEEALGALARQAMETEEDYVLEAHTDYLRHPIDGYDFILAPSAHVVAGRLAEGATIQITRGSVWEGSVYIDEHSCRNVGISVEHFRFVREGMRELLGAFEGNGRSLGFVKGGVDFAIARIGGRFGERPVVGMQDLNLSSNGAEYVRAFLREAREVRGAGVHAATKVVRPTAGTDLRWLKAAVDAADTGHHTRVITSVPSRWGLIAVACQEPQEAAEAVLALEEHLYDEGLLRTVLRHRG